MNDPPKPNSVHPSLAVLKELHLPIFWSRRKDILKFSAEVYANGWLNCTVHSDLLHSKYWDSSMSWLLFIYQLNSFFIYSFLLIFKLFSVIFLYSISQRKEMKAWAHLMMSKSKEFINQRLNYLVKRFWSKRHLNGCGVSVDFLGPSGYGSCTIIKWGIILENNKIHKELWQY